MLLLRFLKFNDFDLEKSKTRLLTYFEMRKKNPKIFLKRDVLGEDFQNVIEYIHAIAISRRTPDNHKVSISQVKATDETKRNILEVIRFMHISLDVKLTENDVEEPPHDGEIFIHDFQSFGLKDAMQFMSNVSVIKHHIRYSQDASPVKMVQNHFLNCSSVFIKLFKLVKPFINKEVADSLNFHPNFETLHAMVPKECLPEEYGGSAGKSCVLNREWMDVIMSKR